jgi:hypothetical protein
MGKVKQKLWELLCHPFRLISLNLPTARCKLSIALKSENKNGLGYSDLCLQILVFVFCLEKLSFSFQVVRLFNYFTNYENLCGEIMISNDL